MLKPVMQIKVSGSAYFATISMKNVGRSVAFDVVTNAKFDVVPKDQPPYVKPGGIGFTNSATNSLFPEDSQDFDVGPYSAPNEPRPLSSDEQAKLLSGEAYLAVFGSSIYRDQFGPHWITFCQWRNFSTKPGDFKARECVNFNRMGDGESPN